MSKRVIVITFLGFILLVTVLVGILSFKYVLIPRSKIASSEEENSDSKVWSERMSGYTPEIYSKTLQKFTDEHPRASIASTLCMINSRLCFNKISDPKQMSTNDKWGPMPQWVVDYSIIVSYTE